MPTASFGGRSSASTFEQVGSPWASPSRPGSGVATGAEELRGRPAPRTGDTRGVRQPLDFYEPPPQFNIMRGRDSVASGRMRVPSDLTDDAPQRFHVPFLSILQPYFKVTTAAVVQRLLLALATWTPAVDNQFWESLLDAPIVPNGTALAPYRGGTAAADLYGPLWICSTLALAFPMASNLASRLVYAWSPGVPPTAVARLLMPLTSKFSSVSFSSTRTLNQVPGDYDGMGTGAAVGPQKAWVGGAEKDSRLEQVWKPNVECIARGAVVIMVAFGTFCFLLWAILQRLRSRKRFVEVLSVAGYSLAPFVVLGALGGAIPLPLVEWAGLFTAAVLATKFLVRSLRWELFQLAYGAVNCGDVEAGDGSVETQAFSSGSPVGLSGPVSGLAGPRSTTFVRLPLELQSHKEELRKRDHGYHHHNLAPSSYQLISRFTVVVLLLYCSLAVVLKLTYFPGIVLRRY